MKRLGELLVDEGLVSPFHVDRAIWWQADDGGRLGSVLIRLGYLDERGFLSVMAPLLNTRPLLVRADRIDPRAVRHIPPRIARRSNAIAVAMRNDRLIVAMTDPDDLTAVHDIEAVAGMRVESCLAADPAVALALDRFYPVPASELVQLPSAQGLEPTRRSAEETDSALDRLIHGWVRDALLSGADALVLEGTPLYLVVRCEIVGGDFEVEQLGGFFHRPLIARLRAAASLPLPQANGWHQTGAFPHRYRGEDIPIGLSIAPATHGPVARLGLGEARRRLVERGLLPTRPRPTPALVGA